MIDIAARDVNKYYGSNHVLKGISFEIYSGEKVGLLGRNGSGKTTLFRIITQDEPCDSGSVSKASGKRIEMLAQIPVFGENDTVDDILSSSFKEATDTHTAMKKIEGDADPAVLARYGRLMEEYERLGGYEIEMKIEKVCKGMNIGEVMRGSPFSLLSGGEKTRVNLARILLRDCDILLLDEPTNHLDLASLEWLESFLRKYSGTVVAISHDRAFLDNVVTRIVEIDGGKAHFFSGNYTWYMEEKQRRVALQTEQYERQQAEIKRIEERAKWFVEQNRYTTKHHAILSRIDHMDKVERPAVTKKLTAEFDSGGYTARVAVSFESVSKSYGSKVLIDNQSLSIAGRDSIALIGDNGCGKTTLLKLIIGEESCDCGAVNVSSNVRIAYMPQIITFEDESATVLDTLRYADYMPEDRARSILAGFRFGSADINKKVGALSGGEKSRLKLCLLMQNNANFLILDEPTNHLDIESREWIEEAVGGFSGTLLFISHDRYFLSKFATRVWNMKDGAITEFIGGFEEYLAKTGTANESPVSTVADKRVKKPPAVKRNPSSRPIPAERLIAEAEAELEKVKSDIESAASRVDFASVNSLYDEKLRLEESIESLYSEWMKGD